MKPVACNQMTPLDKREGWTKGPWDAVKVLHVLGTVRPQAFCVVFQGACQQVDWNAPVEKLQQPHRASLRNPEWKDPRLLASTVLDYWKGRRIDL